MSTRLASVFCTVYAFAVASATAQETWRVQDSGRRVVLPGALDITVVDGSMIPTDCQVQRHQGYVEERRITIDCVAAPLGSSLDLQNAYVRALTDGGWRFSGGAANVFFFERPRAGEDCSDRLAMVGLLLGDPAETDKYGTQQETTMDWSRVTHGAFLFGLEPEPVCGDDRDAP
ncbi:MAG: hypothetical protein K2X34_09535 [Hyphomonadaceae bacterium]|nr:hypothetical protein [Hyphomonadaceae bacterium]